MTTGRLARIAGDDLPTALLFLALVGLALLAPPQPDTWTHVRTGHEIWTSGSIVDVERFSYTAAGRPWHNHEWLSQLLLYATYALGGPFLLTLVAGGCAFLAVVASWRMTRAADEWRLGLLLGVLLLITPAWSVRPQVLTLALLMLAVHLVTSGRSAWMPPLIALWANAHGGVLLGVVVAGVDALEAIIWSPARRRRALLVAGLCVLAPTLTPLGWHYWPRVARTVVESQAAGIQEFRSSLEVAAVPFWVMLALLLGVATRRWRAIPALEAGQRQLVLLGAILGLAGALSVRNVPPFALVAAPAIAVLIGPGPPRRPRAGSPVATAMFACAAVVVVAILAYRWSGGGARLGWHPMSDAVVRAIRDCRGPLFNTFASGGTLLWFARDRQVFVDGRVEVYPLELLQQSRRADLDGDYETLFEEHDIRCAVVPTGSPMAEALDRDQWGVVRAGDRQWTVLERRDDEVASLKPSPPDHRQRTSDSEHWRATAGRPATARIVETGPPAPSQNAPRGPKGSPEGVSRG
jgi:hypothetical protein